MVNRKTAKLYCKEDISLIENYDKAKSDLLEVWDIHHRKEEEGYSVKELIYLGLYYKIPASELIFLTKKEHRSLHMKGKKLSEETKKKMSKANKGEKNNMYGKKHTEEAKKKMSESKSKPVQQIDKQTGDIIGTWQCAMEVERIIGIGHGSISKCCSGKRKSAGGYIWKYA